MEREDETAIAGRPSVIDAARGYLTRGWFPVPIPPREKKAVLTGWNALRLQEADLPKYFRSDSNIGLILGEASGWLVDVDLDCKEALELADQYLPPTPAVTGRPSAPKSHRWYIAADADTEKHTDPRTRKMIVELRSSGLQTVVGPSIHPDAGDIYEILDGEPAVVAAPMLTACVTALAKAVLKQRYGVDMGLPNKSEATFTGPKEYVTDLDVEARAIAYLEKMEPAISGQGGHNATYAAATAVVHGFGIPPERALALLVNYYNPRCEPPWTVKELQHKVEDAANKPHDRPFAWLRDSDNHEPSGVDLSHFMSQSAQATAPPARKARSPTAPDEELTQPVADDPGPTPDELLQVPGFVDDVMRYSLENAPYPDRALAFAGALSLQALLAGRKVRDSGDNRTNLYVVALANSGAGKDFPRKTNEKILLYAGMAECLGDEIGSAEGMLDDLELTPSLLFQTDEIDFLMQAMNQPKESRYQRIMQALLKLFTSANGLYMKRKKVGKQRGYIDQPCVCLYGTAIPDIFYKALSLKMLTNGWFARLLILETPRRGEGRDEEEIADISQAILDRASWWVDFQPGTQGNLQGFHPRPKCVDSTKEAKKRFREFKRECDAEYRSGEQTDSQAAMAIWARAVEKAKKLALIYACSENHEEPLIGKPAAEWACRLVAHQTRRMLFMAGMHVAESDFESKCKRVLELLHHWRKHHGDEWMPFRDISRTLRWSRRDHDEIRATLLDQELIEYDVIRTSGRPRQAYRLPVA